MNRLKTLGIIGGAGPEAGALLFQQIIRICQLKYSCERDHDFPLIHLVSYPFSEMLGENPDHEEINSQLKEVYQSLKSDYVVIACNTLHTFLDDSFQKPRFIHLIELTKSKLQGMPLVLCSSTSKRGKIHERAFPCVYPRESEQKEVDLIIDSVLARNSISDLSERLKTVIETEKQRGTFCDVVLGCTELSVIHDTCPLELEGINIVDPSETAANMLCELSFN